MEEYQTKKSWDINHHNKNSSDFDGTFFAQNKLEKDVIFESRTHLDIFKIICINFKKYVLKSKIYVNYNNKVKYYQPHINKKGEIYVL